jgi:hypothetical protein
MTIPAAADQPLKERTMRPRHAFRPALSDRLEDRTVPSHAGVRAAIVSHFNSASPQVQDARAAQQAFNTFSAAYTHDFRTILYGADSSGNINPAANRARFDAQVAIDLSTLNTSLAKAVSNLSSASMLTTTIQADLLGTDANSLQSLLKGLATPTGVFTSSQRQFIAGARSAINAVDNQVISLIRSAANTNPTPTPTPPTTPPTVQDARAIQREFGTFVRSYFTDVRTILFQAGTDGSINPAANRASFDAQVATDLNTLSASITTTLGNVPSSGTLLTKVQDALVGAGSDSLKSRLAAIPTPTSRFGFSSVIFTVNSNVSIGFANGQVLRDVLTFQPPTTTTM